MHTNVISQGRVNAKLSMDYMSTMERKRERLQLCDRLKHGEMHGYDPNPDPRVPVRIGMSEVLSEWPDTSLRDVRHQGDSYCERQ